MRNFILFIALLCVSLFADDDIFGSGMISAKKGGISSRSTVAMQPSSAESPVDSNYVLGPGDFLT